MGSSTVQDTTAARRAYHRKRYTELGGDPDELRQHGQPGHGASSAGPAAPGTEDAVTDEPGKPGRPSAGFGSGPSVWKKAKKAAFRWRHQAVPGVATATVWTAAAAMHAAHADPRMAALSVVIGGGLTWGINRRRVDRRWKRSYLAFSTGYGALLAQMVATHGPMWAGAGDAWLFAGAVAVGLPWTYRHRIRWQPHTDEPAAPPVEEPAAIEAPTPGQEWIDLWDAKVAATYGPLPGSRLEDWEDVPGGWAATIVLESGSTEVAVARTKDIGAKLRVSAGSIMVEPPADGALHLAKLLVLPENRLQEISYWTGPTLDPATGVSNIARYVDGKSVPYRHYRPGSGPVHDLVTGSTDSGKSTAVSELLAEERHALTEEGEHLIVSWVIDPQGGMSFPDWQRNVGKYARTMAEARDMLREACGRMYARADEFGSLAWVDDQGRDRMGIGEFTPMDPRHRRPMISITIDEAHKVLADDVCRQLVEEMIAMSRKVGIKFRLITQVPLLSYLGNSMAIRDAVVAGNVLVLRTGTRLTGQVALNGALPVEPAALPKEWPDGSTTSGLGFFSGPGADRAAMMRLHKIEDVFGWATAGTTAYAEPFTAPVAGGDGASATNPAPGTAVSGTAGGAASSSVPDVGEMAKSRQQATDAALRVLADGEWHAKSEVTAAMVDVTRSPRTVGHALQKLVEAGLAEHPGDRQPYRITETGLARLAELNVA